MNIIILSTEDIFNNNFLNKKDYIDYINDSLIKLNDNIFLTKDFYDQFLINVLAFEIENFLISYKNIFFSKENINLYIKESIENANCNSTFELGYSATDLNLLFN